MALSPLFSSQRTIIDVDDHLSQNGHLSKTWELNLSQLQGESNTDLASKLEPQPEDPERPLTKDEKINVLCLTLCFALGQASFFTQINTTGIAATEFASEDLATVPVGTLMIVTMFCGWMIQKMLNTYSSTRVYTVTTLVSMVGAVLQVVSTQSQSFALLAIGTAIQGFGYSATLSYRLTVISAVPKRFVPKAIAYVLAGGTLAVIGPEMSRNFIDSFDDRFMGPYVALCGFYVLLLIVIQFIRLDANAYKSIALAPVDDKADADGSARTLSQLLKDPKYVSAVLASAVIYGSMSGIMNATPLEMRDVGHSFDQSTLAVQVHIVGMFFPALFTGHIVNRIGAVPTTVIGFTLFIGFTALYYINDTVPIFAVGMFGVGLGWSMGLVGATAMLSLTFKPSEKTRAQSFNEIVMVLFLAIYVVSASFAKTGLGWELYLGAQMLGIATTLALLLALKRC
eukprot:TRINITY_DN10647_c0_g2_i1.p1 TRINITY_DN10647_c0_g2~~TRINITY_DN10647_c0_g2_i1.p1  ORF type:complete len:455 (+),score=81.62 TRINITY_DN10647_c0_g2_i1:331-1695(+)